MDSNAKLDNNQPKQGKVSSAAEAFAIFTCFAGVFHGGFIGWFRIKAFQRQVLILSRHFGFLVHDIYWRLVSFSARWVSRSPALIWPVYSWGRQECNRVSLLQGPNWIQNWTGFRKTHQRKVTFQNHLMSSSKKLTVCTGKSSDSQSDSAQRKSDSTVGKKKLSFKSQYFEPEHVTSCPSHTLHFS